MRQFVVLVSVLALSAQTAHSTPAGEGRVTKTRPKSRETARILSVGTTFLGWAVMGAGVGFESVGMFFGGQVLSGIGPSTAHLLYTGEVGHGLLFSGIRVSALLAADAALAWGLGCALDAQTSERSDSDCGTGSGALLLAGLGVAAAFGIYDWYDSGRSADRYNAAHSLRLSLAPLHLRDAEDARGLALVGRF